MTSAVHTHPLYVAIVLCVLAGAFTKSAIFPFHYWLPSAMEAPSPVSALLHSATMVKAGVYLVGRLHPSLGGTLLWDDALIFFGGATMLMAAILATRQHALKKILAYSTVSSLGALMMLIGMGAHKAAGYYLLAHALFKGCLFLTSGSLSKQTGEKDPEALAGARRAMPVLATTAFVGALSLIGLFPMLGFVGKELMLKAGLAHPEWREEAIVATVVAATLTVLAGLIVGLRPMTGRPSPAVARAQDPDWRQLAGPVALAVAGVLAGVAPALFAVPLVEGVKSALGIPSPDASISVAQLLWPPSTATILSLGALAAGLALYFNRDRYRRATAPIDRLSAAGPDRGYAAALAGLNRLAGLHTSTVQHGRLRGYVRLALLVASVASLAAAMRADLVALSRDAFDGLNAIDAALALVIAVAAIGAVIQRTALASVAVLGALGFSIAILFVLYGAPDVAMTQFSVETLIVIIFVLVVLRLPRYSRLTSRSGRTIDAGIASAFGLIMGVLTIAAATTAGPEPVSAAHAARAVPEGFGRNVVNVILVDFRAIDTLGEIFVLGIAAVGVATLVGLGSNSSADAESGRADSIILRTGARVILPVMLIFSVVVLLRGHNEPGGGFVGGLLAAAGLALHALAYGSSSARRRLRAHPRTLIGAGLGLALLSGLPGAISTGVFMDPWWATIRPPGFLEPLKIGTPLFFDVGVYLAVLGVTLHMIFALEESLHDRPVRQ